MTPEAIEELRRLYERRGIIGDLMFGVPQREAELLVSAAKELSRERELRVAAEEHAQWAVGEKIQEMELRGKSETALESERTIRLALEDALGKAERDAANLRERIAPFLKAWDSQRYGQGVSARDWRELARAARPEESK